MSIYWKIAKAKDIISNSALKKEGKNTYSNYDYFTPEQVIALVQAASNEIGLLNLFSLKRNEFGVYGVLKIVDVENWESVEVEGATAIPEIKATNAAQQIGGCYTYTNRYLLMLTYWIADNNLDFDTTENTKKVAEPEANDDKPRFNKEQLDKFCKISSEYKGADEALKVIRSKYKVSKVMEGNIRKLYEGLDYIKNNGWAN